MVTPGVAAVCPGVVRHARHDPAVHSFERAVSYVWLDPDRPDQLTDAHPLWSHRRPAPARFRRADYGDRASAGSLADQARDDLAPMLGYRPGGPVRMLTQVRRWGWLFNPITIVLVWHGPDGEADPVGTVLEVTNTPWSERTRYAMPLRRNGTDDALVASVAKTMHVSPFLDEGYDYDLALSERSDDRSLRVAIDVRRHIRAGDEEGRHDVLPVLRTELVVTRVPATRAALSQALRAVAPTHRVSLAIHLQAIRLWRKRVPFVAHPSKRASS